MSNVNISPNMNLPVPVPTQDPGFDWANNLYSCLYSVLDQHNHSSGNGVAIMPAGLNINSALTFQGNSATNLLSAGFSSQSSPLSLGTYPLNLYVSGGNLYYNSSSTQIQLTTPTGVNATSSGISSGTASASFVSGTLVVDEAANTPANIQAGSYLLGNNTAGSDFITIAPAGTIAANYTFGLPLAPPAATSYLTMNSSGAVSPGLVITPNKQISSSSGVISISSSTPTAVNNLSVSITTSGNPVLVYLQADGTGAAANIFVQQTGTGTSFGFVRLLRASSTVFTTTLGSSLVTSSGTLQYPASCVLFMDTQVAGSYTYTIDAFVSTASNITFDSLVLVAYEIK